MPASGLQRGALIRLNITSLRPQKELTVLLLTLVRAEKPEEVLADKLSAIAGRPFCKGRDYFDLWLLKQQGVRLEVKLLKKSWLTMPLLPLIGPAVL